MQWHQCAQGVYEAQPRGTQDGDIREHEVHLLKGPVYVVFPENTLKELCSQAREVFPT